MHKTGFVSRHPYSRQRNIDADALHYVGRFDNPATQFSLRAIDPERYQIINVAEGGYVMEEIEESKAFFQVYDGSVYMFQVMRPCQPNTKCHMRNVWAEAKSCRLFILLLPIVITVSSKWQVCSFAPL